MSPQTQLPEKCLKCAKSKGSSPSEKCDFCGKTDFPESILCDLNRSVQDPEDFTCHAFLPRLKGVSPISLKPVRSEGLRKPARSQRAEDFQKIIVSDKFKYETAFVLQKLDKDPDFVSVNLKFHFALNAVQRRPLFFPEKKYFGFIYDTVLSCSELVGGFPNLIWLAPDHIHVYVESDGEYSPETVLKRMKEFLAKGILEEFPYLKGEIDPAKDLWDEAYFVETVG